jgi:hypothetical protein
LRDVLVGCGRRPGSQHQPADGLKAGADAWDATRKAGALAVKLRPAERDYIAALAQRYAARPPDNRAPLDSAYAQAMGIVAAKHPDDPDAATLYAESLMILQPWNYWTVAESPKVRSRRS